MRSNLRIRCYLWLYRELDVSLFASIARLIPITLLNSLENFMVTLRVSSF